jgi:hypothetical protein
MDRGKDNQRSHTSQEGNNGLTKSQNPPTPTFLTSFPSFSPPEVTRSKRRTPSQPSGESTPLVTDSKKAHSRTISTPATAKKSNTNMNDGSGAGLTSTAMNRTVQAAANLRKTIMDSITSRSTSTVQNQKLFPSGYEAVGDPLLNATDEHVNRIITTCGGAVATVKKYSADLAESNERVAAERNSKLKLVEENRDLRAGLSEKDQEIEALKEQLEVARKLFERYVEKLQPGEKPMIRFLDSPSGPYVLGQTFDHFSHHSLSICRRLLWHNIGDG